MRTRPHSLFESGNPIVGKEASSQSGAAHFGRFVDRGGRLRVIGGRDSIAHVTLCVCGLVAATLHRLFDGGLAVLGRFFDWQLSQRGGLADAAGAEHQWVIALSMV